jgi:hypothetical protein
MVYWIQAGSGTASALSVELDGASTSTGSYTALTPAVGGGSGSGSTTNPVTSFPNGQNVLCCDYWPFLKIKVNTITVASGTPILIVKVLGYAGTSAAAGTGGGGGGATCITGDVTAGSGSGCLAATVVGLESVPFCAGYTPTNGQFIQYTTGGSPNPCYSAATAGGGSGAFSGTGLTVYSGLAGVSLTGATVYFPIGGGSLASATEANVNTFQGSGGTVSGFGADISTALGTTIAANNVVVLTWRKNGSGQSVTCTITNPTTTCSDTTHSFTFVAGDALDIQAVFTGTITATPIWVMSAGVATSTGSAYGVLLEEHTASSSASLQFTTCITSAYDDYEIRVTQLLPATDNIAIQLQGSTNGGSSYVNSGYLWSALGVITGGSGTHGSNSDSSITIATNQAASTNFGLSGVLKLSNPLGTTGFKNFTGTMGGYDSSGDNSPLVYAVTGWVGTSSAVNAFQIFAATGNLASGTVRCYGISH